ncbi:MAG TPA: Fe-S cluster assembly protein SufD [Verrucomicrobiae bacterium]|nr:Fe-S cluster assembly protein SufD [Verrucomicrobiae bacterium]
MTTIAPSSPPSAVEPLRPPWDEPPSLRALREAGAVASRVLAWPSSSRDEEWRRTAQIDRLDPARFAQPVPRDPGEVDRLGPGADPPGYLAEASAGAPAISQAEVILVDDAAGYRGCGPGARPRPGAGPVAVALPRAGGALARLGTVLPPRTGAVVAHNTARFASATLIEVRRGDPPATVHLVHGVEPGQVAWPRTVVLLGEGAECTVIEEWLSPPEPGAALVAPVTELVLGAGARCRHVLVQRLGPGGVLLASIRAELDRDATYEAGWILVGGAWSKVALEVALQGPGASARLSGCAAAGGTQHIDLQTTQAHQAPATTSDCLHRTVMRGRARSVYAGLIQVAPAAQKTNAYVQNRNLLLSPTAKADSNPTLEILANDVRCTHGATAGPVDRDQLFYCQSRGIEPLAARDLIVTGFLADVVDRLPLEGLRQAAWEWLAPAASDAAGGLASRRDE